MTVIAWDGLSEYDEKSYRAINIDGRQFLSTTPIAVGSLMAAVGRDSSYQFFKDIDSDPAAWAPDRPYRGDTLLQPTDVLSLENGDCFYGIPPAIFNCYKGPVLREKPQAAPEAGRIPVFGGGSGERTPMSIEQLEHERRNRQAQQLRILRIALEAIYGTPELTLVEARNLARQALEDTE